MYIDYTDTKIKINKIKLKNYKEFYILLDIKKEKVIKTVKMNTDFGREKEIYFKNNKKNRNFKY